MDLRVKLKAKDIFIFSIFHFYKSVMGAVSVICTLLVLGVVAASWPMQTGIFRVILLLGAVVVAACQPFMIYQKAGRQVRDPQLGKEIQYKMDYNGVRVRQGKEKAVIGWNQIARVGRMPGLYVLYLNKSRAYLLPDRALVSGKKEQLLKLLNQYVPIEKRKGI